jgi:hypothetical protein
MAIGDKFINKMEVDEDSELQRIIEMSKNQK